MKNPGRQFKDAIYEQFSRISKTVSGPKRLELLDLICQGEKTVETFLRETGLTVANTSQHLQTLKAAKGSGNSCLLPGTLLCSRLSGCRNAAWKGF